MFAETKWNGQMLNIYVLPEFMENIKCEEEQNETSVFTSAAQLLEMEEWIQTVNFR